MAFPQGISFRSTSAYVTDVSPSTFEIGTGVNYPRTSAQGNTVGWETVPSTIQARNRNSGNDARLAGCAFPNTASDVVKYRIDLPATGSYNVRWAAGEANYAQSVVGSLYDTTTLLTALSTGSTSAAQRFKDATNVEYTNTTWAGSNTATTKTFASTILRVQTLGSVSCFFAHLYVESGAVAAPKVPVNFPNPTRKVAIDARGFLGNVNLELISKDKFFGAAGQGPTYDYPNPRGATYPSGLRTFINQVELQLINQDQFFGDAGQPLAFEPPPNPIGKAFPSDLRTFTNQVNLQLLSRDKFFGLAGNPLRDWPVPKGPMYGISLRTWTDPLKLNLRSRDQFFGAAGQPPAYEPPPNPTVAVPASTLRTWLDTLKLNLLGQDTFFGGAGQPPANLDWPVPKGAAFTISLRTHTDPLKLNLRNQDQFFGAPGQAPEYQPPPNPIGAAYPSSLRTWLDSLHLNLLNQDTIYGAPGQVPTYDWVVPKGPPYAIDLRTSTANLIPELVGQDQFFGAAGQPPTYTWTITPASPFPIGLRSWHGNLLQTTLGAVTPFNFSGWVSPAGVTYPIGLRTFTNSVGLNLIGQDQFFGAAGQPPTYDYPNPQTLRPAASTLRTWLDTGYVLLVGALALPFALFDWPNPFAKTPNTALRTHLDPLKLNLRNQDQFFGAAGQPPIYDWQLPQVPRPATALRTWTDAGFLLLITVVNFPFALLNWPNPPGAIFALSLRTWLDDLKLNLQGQDQFYGAPGQPPVYNWTVPPAPRPASTLRTWIDSGFMLLTAIVRAPFALFDWPNPLRKHPGISLRTHTDPLKLNLRGQDQFFGAPGQPPAFAPPLSPAGKPYPIDLRTFLSRARQGLVPFIVTVTCLFIRKALDTEIEVTQALVTNITLASIVPTQVLSTTSLTTALTVDTGMLTNIEIRVVVCDE